MTDDFTSDALRYLLGEMDPDQHRAFTERMARDPVAAQAFKDCADSLTQFAISAAAPRPVSEFEREANLAAILARARPAAVPVPNRRRSWGALAWPIAAALLIALNLLQFFSPRGVPPAGTTPGTSLADASAASARTTTSGGSPSPSPTGLTSASAGTSSNSTTGTPDRLTAEFARLEELRRDYAMLKQARDSLDQQYNVALQQLARRALTEQGIGRLAAMELVDANSYARGDRKGLMNLARDLLTEPGIVVVDPGRGGPGEVGVSEVPSLLPGGGTPSTSTEAPYAWSVFDEKDNRGYLNLYNLPNVAPTDTLQVWVKPAGSAEFQPVGLVPPQYYGKSGSVSYELPAGNATPSEVLITLEPRQNRPARPTGPVVLRGP